MLSGSLCKVVPSSILPNALKVSGSIPYLMLWTEPSAKTALIPAGCAEPNCIIDGQESPPGSSLVGTSWCGFDKAALPYRLDCNTADERIMSASVPSNG